MPAQSYSRVERIRLEGYIDLHATLRITNTIMDRVDHALPTLFSVDCSHVTAFSGCALVGIAQLRRELRARGCELELVRCPSGVKSQVIGVLFETLLDESAPLTAAAAAIQEADEPVYEKEPEQIGLFRNDEPPFYLHNIRIQWYWLN